MRIFTFLVLIVAGVAGVGFYRGWFNVTSDSSAENSGVTVTVDKEKIQQDKDDAKTKVQDLKQE